ncbi:MAG: shikimate kinase [Pirellulaceae bacterium]
MHIYLIGYRGTGKTTVARLLGQVMERTVIDTDDLIEAVANQTIAEIFAAEGEAGFRQRESAVIAEVAGSAVPQIVATGGGVVLSEENRHTISRSGQAIWLRASAELLYQRICGDPSSPARRPQLSASGGIDEVNDLLRAREPLYRELARKIITTDGLSPDEVVAEILDWVKSEAR